MRGIGYAFVSEDRIFAINSYHITLCRKLQRVFIGKKLGLLLGDRAEMVGGVVLILIGLKAFFG